MATVSGIQSVVRYSQAAEIYYFETFCYKNKTFSVTVLKIWTDFHDTYNASETVATFCMEC